MPEQKSASNQLDPSNIMQVGLGFWASKTLLVATKLGLFTLLDEGARTPEQIRAARGPDQCGDRPQMMVTVSKAVTESEISF